MSKSTPLFDVNGQPTSALLQVLDITGVRHKGTSQNIRDATQAAWYQGGKLRAEIEEKHGALRDELLPLFRQLGMVDAVTWGDYEAWEQIVLLGATYAAVDKRLQFICNEMQSPAVRLEHHLWFLGNYRPLLDREYAEMCFQYDYQHPIAVAKVPTTEIEMMDMVAQRLHAASKGGRLSFGSTIVCGVPSKDGKHANTEECLRFWKQLKHYRMSVLLVSSQPYVSFQQTIAEKILGPEWRSVKAVGYEAPETTKVSQYLDNLAKWIYELPPMPA